MAWFPKDQNIPPGSNVPMSHETIVMCASILDARNRSPIQMDDFTFIIPFGLDCNERFENLSDVLLYIMTNTTAKVKLVWSESEKSLRENKLYKVLRDHTPGELVDTFRQDSSNEAFVNLVSSEAAVNNHFATSFLFSMCGNSIVGRDFRAGTSGTWWDSLDATGSGGNPLGTDQFQVFLHECISRIEISAYLREDDDPFDRMKYINLALATVETKFVCNHDSDVLMTRSALMNTVYQLRSTSLDVVYPYAYKDISKSQLRVFRDANSNNLITLACLTGDFTPLVLAGSHIMWTAGYGQSIFARTESYKSAGGENENFRSWGAEDVERYVRFVKLGYAVGRTESGYVVHLEHPRGADSSKENPFFESNEELWSYLQKLSPESLLDVYQNFDYVKERGFYVNPKRELGS